MKIYIVTGEKSGDQHAAKIVKEIKNQNKDIKIGAWGGDGACRFGLSLPKCSR